jgi:hypothetical protein
LDPQGEGLQGSMGLVTGGGAKIVKIKLYKTNILGGFKNIFYSK